MKPTEELIEAVAVTAELTATPLSKIAARIMAEDLALYPIKQVLGALTKCRRELRPRGLTIEAVVTRLDDGRPGPEQAWAMMPRSELDTVVWTDEMCQAWGIARPLLDEGDQVAARMAFVEAYRRMIQAARDAGAPVHWTVSLGHDPHGREPVLLEAVRLSRLTQAHVAGLLPLRDEPNPAVVAMLEGVQKRLEAKPQ